MNKTIFGKILLASLTLFFIFLFSLISFSDYINNLVRDSFFNLEQASNDIVIVAIDEKSTQLKPYGLGKFTWWTRKDLIPVLERLGQAEVIGIDLIFNTYSTAFDLGELDRLEYLIEKENDAETGVNIFLDDLKYTQPNYIDELFINSLKNKNNVVIAEAYDPESSVFIKPIDELLKYTYQGFVNTNKDEKGVIRSFFTKIGDHKHFAYKIAEIIKGDLSLNTVEIINYFGDAESYEYVSYIDVYDGKYKEDYFDDKIVLIGTTSAKEVQDVHMTPRSNESPMAGVEVHANAIQTILDGKFLEEQGVVGQVLTLVILAFVMSFAFTKLGILSSTVLMLVSLIAYYFAGHIAYRQGLLLNMINPLLLIVFTYVAAWIYRYFVADKDKRQIKGAFAHYVSKDLVEQIAKRPETVKLGGEKRLVTVFFSDIKDSTKHSETVEISQWVKQINEYFTMMEMIVKKHGGTIDKFEGDAIMGFWNAPLEDKMHVRRAYLAALEMQRVLEKLHSKWRVENKPLIKFRIGINTGEALVGNFGSLNRFDYTVMGDTVNTASRLESSANKAYGTNIVVAGFLEHLTSQNLNDFIFRELDTVYLPGKNEATKIYELIDFKSEANENLKIALINDYASALSAYRKKDFSTALATLAPHIQSDTPSKILYSRIQLIQSGQKLENLDQDNMIWRISSK